MEKRKCRKCGNLHEVYKTVFKNDTKHLLLICDTARGKTGRVYIPYEELELPTTKIIKNKKLEIENTQSLFI